MAERKEGNRLERKNGVESTKIFDRLTPRDKAASEVESWLSRIEKDPQQIQDQQFQNTATDLKAVSQKTDDIYTVPTTRPKFVSGFKQGINDAAKWLSVFILRIIKKKEGKVKFLKEEENA